MAALSREVYGRMADARAFWPGRAAMLVEDLEDQFGASAPWPRAAGVPAGVIEFYQARTNTKMTIAAERLAVIAAVTLPMTALSSISA